ncbi:Hypothetical protein R9X50_00724600 [Acrodontium crateriforme]|uniref:Uncharacterized protein n=1 Tax=Acrodontium crateriforme TaxID=150365 RepID=A0AAQ3R7G6_9PEZI|nr:Hypothetical protein R9X50_00724600 [Acrodontium crateriforme]
MPPLRNLPPVKLPLKTERTHEENQERAYIAASRRSDRSLEARVESARRASEIHKKRTGRSLRVTESDVMNEEMYEEEDDDLPAQYRRLTAHLHTQNAQFDRRWQAYLINQVAMRSALGQTMQNGQANPLFPTGPLSPNITQMQQVNGFQNPMMSPLAFNQSSPSYRQSPYPLSQGMRQNGHDRSASIAVPQQQSTIGSPIEPIKTEERRNSLPTQTRPNLKRSASSELTLPSKKREQTSTPGSSSDMPSAPQQQQSNPSPFNVGSLFNTHFDDNSNPLSMSLPMESQQMLAGAPIDMNDPIMSAMMGNPYSGQSSYSFNHNPKFDYSSNNMSGLDQTLVPSNLELNKAANANMSNTLWDYPDAPQMPDNSQFKAAIEARYAGVGNDSTAGTPFDDNSWSSFIDGGIFGSDELEEGLET